MQAFLGRYGKSEVSDPHLPIVSKEDVIWLEIAMDQSMSVDAAIADDDLAHEMDSFSFGKFSLGGQEIPERASSTMLVNDIDAVLCLKGVFQL